VTVVALTEALSSLRATLRDTRLPLFLPSRDAAKAAATQVTSQLDDYVLPRLADIGAPLLAVVGGSTGAGKSTLVNSLVGREVSRSSVIRPTTKSPVLVMSPSDEHWFADARILPGLTRSFHPSESSTQLQLVAEPTLPVGLAILDAPDIDSVVTANRQLAAQLLDAADLWLFVTSAARYSDAVPWQFLASAAARSAVVAIVLDRVPQQAIPVVPDDLRRLMADGGLADTQLFVVPETPPDRQGLLPDDAVAPVRDWLVGLAASEASRREVVLQTLDGAIGAVVNTASIVADAADEQVSACQLLEADATAVYREAERQVAAQASDGSLLRGEVLARWHDYVGTTAFVRMLDQKVSWLRDKVASLFRGPSDGTFVKTAAKASLQVLIVEAAEQAASRAAAAWQAQPAGRALLEGRADLGRASAGFVDAVAKSMSAWQADVLALVTQEGASKRQGARLAAAGVNGAGAALMLVIFASTGGITGAEIGIAGGTTVIAQKLLESIFGDEAVRRLATTAKANLIARIDGLLAAELARYMALLDGLGVAIDGAARIDSIIDEVAMRRAAGYGDEPLAPPPPTPPPVPAPHDKWHPAPIAPPSPVPVRDEAAEMTAIVAIPGDPEAAEMTRMVGVPDDPEAAEMTTMINTGDGAA